MEKITIACKKCKKQMKIQNKPAKYRCPYCSEVIQVRKTRLILEKGRRVSKDFVKTIADLYKTISYKLKLVKNSFKKKWKID